MYKHLLFFTILLNLPLGAFDNFNNQGLADNFKLYKTTNVEWHAGDLYEHSIWVATIIDRWFQKNKFWVQGLSDNDRTLAIICGFIHDIGKAGDLDFIFKNKAAHPYDGFLYLIHKKPFFLNEKLTLNINDWFIANHLNSEDQKIVAIIVGIHWEFGLVLKRINEGESKEIVFKDFMAKLEQLTQEAHYNNGRVTKRLLLLSILINAADVKGLRYAAPCCCQNFFNLPDTKEKRSVQNDAYYIHGHKKTGKAAREQLISYFETYY